MAVTYSYGGGTTLTVTVTGATDGFYYGVNCWDNNFVFDDAVAAGGVATINITGLGGSAGQRFGVFVFEGTGGGVGNGDPCIGDNVFEYGTASTTGAGFDATWDYDGSTTVEVTFVAVGGVEYGLAANTGSGFESTTGGPYTNGSTQTLPLTVTAATPGRGFFATLYNGDGTDIPTYANRLFVGGSAGDGAAGNPPATGGVLEGVCIAPDDNMFTVDPIWVRLDLGIAGLHVASIDIERGRQDEFERTGTGTCTVIFNDTAGVLDPTNISSPFFGQLDAKPFGVAIRNPVTDTYEPRFRGVIDSYGFNLSPSQGVNQTAVVAVDMFDYLAGFELAPGLAGDAPPADSVGFVFYEDTAGTVDDRILQALADASVPSGLSTVFTGNVSVQESKYSPGESILTVLQDAADAEFPTVANLYVDRFGKFAFHGRFARFDPDGVSSQPGSTWDFHRWKVGDGTAIGLDADRAQARPPFEWSRGLKMVRNAAMCWPQGLPTADRDGQVVVDATSIGSPSYLGVRSWSAENLYVKEGTTTGNTAAQECLLYAQYIVDNYAFPVDRIETLTILSLRPDDPRGEPTWDLLTRADISDIVDVAIDHPGGGGFANVEFFVEGIRETITPLHKDLDTGYPMIRQNLTLSPVAYWSSNPFDS